MGNKNPFKSLRLRPTPSSPNTRPLAADVPSTTHTENHQRVLTSRDVQRAYHSRQSVRSTGAGVYVLSGGRHAQSESALQRDGPQSSCDRSSPDPSPPQRSSSPPFVSPSPAGGWSSDFPQVSQSTPESNRAHYRGTRANQFIKWTKVVIPSLIQPYLALTRRTENLGAVDREYITACSCQQTNARALTITCVYFDSEYIPIFTSMQLSNRLGLKQIVLQTCHCTPAPAALLARGLMASSPTHPTLAVDIKLLEFARLQFLHMVPNTTGWCAALEACLTSLGFKLQTRVSTFITSLTLMLIKWY